MSVNNTREFNLFDEDNLIIRKVIFNKIQSELDDIEKLQNLINSQTEEVREGLN